MQRRYRLTGLGAPALAAIEQSQRLVRADMAAMATRKQVTQWASGAVEPPAPPAWQAAQEALQTALAITPDNPGLQEQMGDLHAVAGRRDWPDPAARTQHFTQAAGYYQRALSLRPGDPQTWASLAAAYQGTGQWGAPLHDAWARALQLGPNEGHVQPMLLETALATWNQATPQMQQWAMRLFEASPEAQRRAINASAGQHGLHFDTQLPAPASNTSR